MHLGMSATMPQTDQASGRRLTAWPVGEALVCTDSFLGTALPRPEPTDVLHGAQVPLHLSVAFSMHSQAFAAASRALEERPPVLLETPRSNQHTPKVQNARSLAVIPGDQPVLGTIRVVSASKHPLSSVCL